MLLLGFGIARVASAATDGWTVSWGTPQTSAERQAELALMGYGEVNYYELTRVSWVRALADTAAAPDTRFAVHYIGRLLATTPTDPAFTNVLTADDLAAQYINLPTAWDFQKGSAGVIIGVLDSGIDTSHPDLKNKYDNIVSYVTGDAYPGDKNGHGTSVAALIAGEANNDTGIAGVCWNCRIVSIKIASNSGSVAAADLAEGIRWAMTQNVQILNMSVGFGTTDPGSVLSSAVSDAYNQGIYMVGAAGNSATNGTEYPARYDNVIAVGAIDPTTGTRGAFSAYNTDLELTAPGVSMYSDSICGGSNMYIGDGTSFAAPLVAGVAGLVWSEQPSLSRDELRNRLNSSAKDLYTAGWDENSGWGCVDAAAALRVAAYRVSGGKDVISYPNPFRVRNGGTVTIRPAQDAGALTVNFYSLDGRLLRTLSGTNEVQWDGRTEGGSIVSAGVYLFQASASNIKDEGRITVIDW